MWHLIGESYCLKECRVFQFYVPLGKAWFLKPKSKILNTVDRVEIEWKPKALLLASWTNIWSFCNKPCIRPKLHKEAYSITNSVVPF